MSRKDGRAKPVSIWTIIPFLVLMIAAALIVPLENYASRNPVMTRNDLYVIAPIGDWDYMMRASDGTEFYVNFCKSMGYEPPFDSGETIKEIRFKNYGYCWHPVRYIMERDSKGQLIRR